ncbi:MAG: fibronectin type III domain-containing protein [Lachnospiraceae bacterium]|nr:fibronectin type III domain-containing protein [Lachnospiraceae bacterium]MDE6251549.1 fibronectin type III domain-containing protein [Lachnospiraceae bacterium]
MISRFYGVLNKNKLWSGKRILSGVLSLSVMASLFTEITFMSKADAAEQVTLHNPVITEDSTTEAGQKVTWDCVWFGSYPQTEVKKTDSEYASLKSASSWDSNGDIVINGTKYRRMLKGDATYDYATSDSGSEDDNYYDWEDDTTYHYFRCEPVKWRVLKTDEKSAMLLSDIVLDDREYNTKYKDVTWETSTIRSWLNGYGAEKNQEDINYGSSNFIDNAFTSQEKSAIADTKVVNNDNLNYDTEGGNDTVDKLFLLSESEVYTDNAAAYGFVSNSSTDDEARRCKSSDYAKAMGVYSSTLAGYKYCYWWLRSPGYSSDSAAYVYGDGYIGSSGDSVSDCNDGVRVALNLNLLASNLYTYAGTVCSDGTVYTPKKSQTIKATKSYTKTYGAKPFKLNAKLTTGECTSVHGTLKYTSSDKSVAAVDKNGKVTIKGTGICTITVTASATDIYKAASSKITITVKPKKNTVTKIKVSGGRMLSVTWKKDTKGTGYELQYSIAKSFTGKNTVTVNISKNKTTSYNIRKLTKGKKYYVRIRTYRNVKSQGKTKKLYGDWSAVKQSGKVR